MPILIIKLTLYPLKLLTYRELSSNSLPKSHSNPLFQMLLKSTLLCLPTFLSPLLQKQSKKITICLIKIKTLLPLLLQLKKLTLFFPNSLLILLNYKLNMLNLLNPLYSNICKYMSSLSKNFAKALMTFFLRS